MPPNGDSRRFAVALSFPGAHRDRAEGIATHLAGTLGRERVLYDRWYREEFARFNLDTYLTKLYRERSELLVVFLCAPYAQSEWCGWSGAWCGI